MLNTIFCSMEHHHKIGIYIGSKKGTPTKKIRIRKLLSAPMQDRTADLPLTKRTLYH